MCNKMTNLTKAIEQLSKCFENQKIDIPPMSNAMEEFINKIDKEKWTNLDNEIRKTISSLASAEKVLKSAVDSDTVNALKNALISLEYNKCNEIVNSAFVSPTVIASDLIAIKSVVDVQGIDIALPKGVKSRLDKINKQTVITLSKNNTMEFSVDKKLFQTENGHDANIEEINSICHCKESLLKLSGSSSLIPKTESEEEFISENELVTLMNDLSENILKAHKSEAASKIYDYLQRVHKNNTNSAMLEKEKYYHARDYDKESAPPLLKEMRQSPSGIASAGRYNYTGQSHYYFADKVEGSYHEITKHNSDKNVQIAVLIPIKEVLLVDFSQSMMNGRKFLNYLRKEGELNQAAPRQYLIPQFVANCCQNIGFDGIKYYGTKEYNNYVVWDDSCLEIESVFQIN